MKNTPKKKSGDNGGLIALLIGLGVVVVALGIVIWLIVGGKAQGPGGGNTEDDTNDETTIMTNAPTEVDVMSTYGEELLTQKTEESLDLAMQYYDEKSQGATDDDAYFDVESVRISLLVENGYTPEAINYLDKVQKDRLNDVQLYTIYGYYRIAYRGLGDEIQANEYQSKMDSIKANSRYEV